VDYPTITLDAFGVYITASEYNVQGALVGYNIFAMGKTLVQNGTDLYAQRVWSRLPTWAACGTT